ncbi:MAG: hypothetical protein AABY15_02945 [Nanoarchaeota archaeon]
MNFEDQITDLQFGVDVTPRTYVRWKNTEEGRDKTDCYERVNVNPPYYVNTNNRSSMVFKSSPFFDVLERLFTKAKELSKAMTLQEKIELVKSDMLSRFPGCYHTIRILLWDDGTDLVECRHGDGEKIYNSTFYNGALTFEVIKTLSNKIQVDEFGKEYIVVEK